MDKCAVGLGTLLLKESAESAITKALDLSCTLIDTGEHYGNLDLLGAALKKSTNQPCIVVKLSGLPSGEYTEVQKRMNKMLGSLGIDRADLCLMHWPGLCSWDPEDMTPLASPADFQGKASSWDEFCANIAAAWANMINLKTDGFCAEIGTSNFYSHHLEELATKCDGAVPYANEIFIDATNQEERLVNDMQSQGIRVLAYRPVAYKPFPEEIKKIAERFGDHVSPQSVILAWLLKRGIWPLVKCRGDHIEQNLKISADLVDKITEEDLDKLKRCEGDIRYSAEWFAKIWKFHNSASTFSDEDVQMLVGMGVDESKARAVLQKSGGDIDAALDLAFAE